MTRGLPLRRSCNVCAHWAAHPIGVESEAEASSPRLMAHATRHAHLLRLKGDGLGGLWSRLGRDSYVFIITGSPFCILFYFVVGRAPDMVCSSSSSSSSSSCLFSRRIFTTVDRGVFSFGGDNSSDWRVSTRVKHGTAFLLFSWVNWVSSSQPPLHCAQKWTKETSQRLAWLFLFSFYSVSTFWKRHTFYFFLFLLYLYLYL